MQDDRTANHLIVEVDVELDLLRLLCLGFAAVGALTSCGLLQIIRIAHKIAEQRDYCRTVKLTRHARHPRRHIGVADDSDTFVVNELSGLGQGTVAALLGDLMNEEEGLLVNLDDEVIRGAIVLHEGKMLWPAPAAPTPAAPPEPGVPTQSSASVAVAKAASNKHDEGNGISPVMLAVIGIVLLGLGWVAPASVLSHFTVFMLAVFVGFQVVWNVKPALHTPLMSVTNAISGIILVGGMLQLAGTNLNLTTILGAIAVLIAAINIAGGFLVTNRMLAMFRK